MRERVSAISLALLLVGLLALIINGTIGEVVVMPLLLLGWAAQVLYQSIHQGLLWGVLVLLAVLLVAKSLPWAGEQPPPAPPQSSAHGRVADWSRWLRESGRDQHSRWRLAQRLSLLAIETLAFREQCAPQEISRRMEQGTLDLPPQLRDYLRAGSRAYRPQPRPLARLFSRPTPGAARADPLAADPQLVIEYLEETMQQMNGVAR